MRDSFRGPRLDGGACNSLANMARNHHCAGHSRPGCGPTPALQARAQAAMTDALSDFENTRGGKFGRINDSESCPIAKSDSRLQIGGGDEQNISPSVSSLHRQIRTASPIWSHASSWGISNLKPVGLWELELAKWDSPSRRQCRQERVTEEQWRRSRA